MRKLPSAWEKMASSHGMCMRYVADNAYLTNAFPSHEMVYRTNILFKCMSCGSLKCEIQFYGQQNVF